MDDACVSFFSCLYCVRRTRSIDTAYRAPLKTGKNGRKWRMDISGRGRRRIRELARRLLCMKSRNDGLYMQRGEHPSVRCARERRAVREARPLPPPPHSRRICISTGLYFFDIEHSAQSLGPRVEIAPLPSGILSSLRRR